MGVTPERSRREFQVRPSEASDPIQDRLVPWVNLADVDLILLGRVSLLRTLLSVISGHPKGRSVVPRSSCLPESSPRLSAPPGPAVVAGWRSAVYRKDLPSGVSRYYGRSSQCQWCFWPCVGSLIENSLKGFCLSGFFP